MRFALVLAAALLGVCGSATAQISIEVGLPSIRIGVRLGGYPDLVAVPGYPVYYAPQLDSNLFFYDGLYWVYAQDRWYSSSWYDGPWDLMEPEAVPYFVLRVPVQYYRQPPVYFRGWAREAPPRWGEHWGRDWEQRHGDWDRWDRRSAPAPAPLPTYQRQYSGERYPDAGRQRELRENNYRYQPHEAVVRQQYSRPAPAPAPRADRPQPSAPSPTPERGHAPDRADRPDRGSTAGRTDSRPATTAPAPDARRAPADRNPASRDAQAPAKRDTPPKPAEQARSTPSPDANRQQQQQEQRQQKQQQEQRQQQQRQQPQEQQQQRQQPQEQQQPRQQHEAQAPRGRESADRPQAKAPEREQKKEPERDH
jgi:hypothetical protein